MRHSKKHPLLLGSLLILGSGVAMADGLDFDADANGTVDRGEYYIGAGATGQYNTWDMNDDGLLDENEYGRIDADWRFDDLDADDNDFLDAGEWYDATFDAFDDNEDGHWDGDEWDDAGDAGFWDV